MTGKRQEDARAHKRSPTEVDKQVGANIRRLRNDLRMTLNELAERLGVSQQQIQKYETGNSRVSASMILAMSDELNIAIEDLFLGTRTRKRPKTDPMETARRECHMWINRANSPDALNQMARVLKAMSGKD